jgi:hypothetical protein
MTRGGPVRRWSPVRRGVFPALLGLFAGCAAMESVPPERLAELEARSKACAEALPAIARYDVDRFGAVHASATGSEADVYERNFQDCVARRGRWTTWTPGQPAPMLEPPGTDKPDASPGLRVP